MQGKKSKMAAWLAVLCVSSVTLLLASPTPSARAATCPNEGIRAEQGAAALALPDCRAYELVSPGSNPLVRADNHLGGGAAGGKAAPDGEGLSYYSRYPAQDLTRSSETYLSRRDAVSGWSVISLDPQMTHTPSAAGECQPGVALSEDLESYVFIAGGNLAESTKQEEGGNPTVGQCGMPQEELAPGEPRGYSNLYLRRDGSAFALVNDPAPAAAIPANATYQAASTDLSRIVFSEAAELAPGSSPGYNLFEWSDGVIRSVGLLPTGEAVPAVVGAATEDWNGGAGSTLGFAQANHAVSSDGESVFFEANGNLYLRENAGQAPSVNPNCRTKPRLPGACTLQVDVSFGSDPSGGGVFQFASRNGERVFFTSDHALTPLSNAVAGRSDLYEYDVKANQITDVSYRPGPAANVRGISGGADDGSRLYFVADGALTGSQQNERGEVAQVGKQNLYLHEAGQPLTYVTTFAGVADENELKGWWNPKGDANGNLGNAWSPSGRYLLFASFGSLTGFDNTCQGGSTACLELYLFDAVTHSLSCVSCDPDGSRPLGNTLNFTRSEFERLVTGPAYVPRIVSDAGQVFFETPNPLSPRDVNGVSDVYEYRAGNFNLISSGTTVGGSAFVDASADRSDVFFITAESLVRADTDGGLPSVYDARVGGGFAEPAPPSEPCRGEESCRPGGPVAPPSAAPPATPGFAGGGNVKPKPPCKHGKVRRGGHCVKKKKAHHKKKSHHHRHAGAGKGGKS